MKMACDDLGMKLVSGHVHVDEYFDKTIEEAVQSGQEYLICSTMPFKGQNSDTYKRVADLFNVAGEKCRSNGLKFGYHNHEYEFETDGDEILYDILMDNTDPELVYMELDLGWVVAAGKKPIDYFKKYEGRFPCWHLKDMNLQENESTEFGKGALDIALMLQNKELSGTQHIFIEQEEYAENAFASMQHNMQFLKGLY
jgi:sugar phosphate isomerase/epimerase